MSQYTGYKCVSNDVAAVAVVVVVDAVVAVVRFIPMFLRERERQIRRKSRR